MAIATSNITKYVPTTTTLKNHNSLEFCDDNLLNNDGMAN